MVGELAVLIGMGVGLGVYAGLVIKKVVGQRRAIERAAAPENPAIPSVSMEEIRSDPERWLPILDGKVLSIHLVSAPEFTAGGEGGNSVNPRFVCFLVDSHGEPHDLASGSRAPPLERDAEWLARQLNVELDHRI